MNASLFWNYVTDQSEKTHVNAIKRIENGEFIEVLRLPIAETLLEALEKNDEDLISIWKTKIEKYAATCDTTEMQSEFLAVGVSFLFLFLQQNWTGPDINVEQLPSLTVLKNKNCENKNKAIIDELVLDGENVVSIVQYPELILLSRLIISESYKKFNLKIVQFWHLRCLFIHQQILEETSAKIFDELNLLIDQIRSTLNEQLDIQSIEQYLEFARIHLYYSYVQKSKFDIEKAMEYSKINTCLTGALGKRTKFQQTDLPQLTLKVDIDGDDNHPSDYPVASLPVDHMLDDEVRLNKIKFKNNLDGEHPDLTPLQQAVILGVFCQTQKSQPKDKLADEELQALISCLLDKPKVWCIKLTTLLFRSRLESTHKRGVERAMMQIQALVDNIGGNEPDVKDKFKFFFVSYQPPKWEVESSLANIMMSMGAIKSALDIYLRLQEWENVIHCYTALEMPHKAKEVIEQELKKNPTPKLWCYLGDATQDVAHYETAWKLSGERSARAQRHWAMYYYKRQEYGKSIEHFQASLEKNSLQSELWYRLGYAALAEEKWEISATAYRRYCVLDPECFEAWNNLARCYCELNQKQRAWRALQEALKVDYSNWRVWDNYMLVCSDLKELDEVIRSYHQILNLKEKHVDLPILRCLVYGFKEAESNVQEKEESEDKQALVKDLNKFREKLLTLFGRLTSQVLAVSDLWLLYSEVVSPETEEGRLKKQQLLLKTYSSAVNKNGWVKSLESCKEVIEILLKLIDASLAVGQRRALMSCEMSVSGCLVSIKKEHPDPEMTEELEKKLAVVEKQLASSD